MVGPLKISLIQSGMSERRAMGSSRSLGTQSLACRPELTAYSTKCLPCHRSCLRPLPHQRPGPCHPCSVERRRPQLRGTEGCGTLRGRPERPGTYTHTTAEKYWSGRREFTKAVQPLTTWLNWKRSSKEQLSCGTSPVKTSTTAENTSAVDGR